MRNAIRTENGKHLPVDLLYEARDWLPIALNLSYLLFCTPRIWAKAALKHVRNAKPFAMKNAKKIGGRCRSMKAAYVSEYQTIERESG
jgi:hypothetical protein